MYTGTLDAVSNRQDWQIAFEIIDDDADEQVDISGATIVFEVREQTDDPPESKLSRTLLSATTANGKITILETGTFQVWFTAIDMRTICAGYYDVGCTITLNGLTTQLMAAELSVIDGVVR